MYITLPAVNNAAVINSVARRRRSRKTVLHTIVFAAPRYPAYRGKRLLTVRGYGRSYRGLSSVNLAGVRVLGVYCGARIGRCSQ